TYSVRLIGIDSPETVHPTKPVQCFGKEASAHLATLLPAGTKVTLETDSIGDTVDKYGRLLRYVNLGGHDIDAQMVSEGYAYAYLKYPFSRSTQYKALEDAARHDDRGLWAPGVCDVPTAYPSNIITPTSTGGGPIPVNFQPATHTPTTQTQP